MPTSNLKKKKSSTRTTSSSRKSTSRVSPSRYRRDDYAYSLIQDSDNTRVNKVVAVPYPIALKTGKSTVTVGSSKTREQDEREKLQRKGINPSRRAKLTPKQAKILEASQLWSKDFKWLEGLGIPKLYISYMLNNPETLKKFKELIDMGIRPEGAFNNVYINPNGTISEIDQLTWENRNGTVKNWMDALDVTGARFDKNAPLWKRTLDNATSIFTSPAESKNNPFKGLWNGFGLAGVASAALTNPATFGKFLLSYELGNNSPKFFGSDKSVTDYVARAIPGMSEEFANNIGMVAAGGAKPTYNKVIKPTFNESMLQAGKLGWEPGKNYTVNRAINEGINDFQGYLPTFLKEGLQAPYLRYERGNIEDIENNIRTQDFFEPTKQTWHNPSLIGKGTNIPGRPPYGLSRRIRVFDAADPNAVYPLEYVTNTGRTSYGEGNAVELTQLHRHPYTDVSSKVPEGNPETQELLGAYASMLIDPNMYPSMRHLKLSTTTPTPRNMLLLESMARNLELEPNGVREGFIPWNKLLKPEVPVYGIKSAEAPVAKRTISPEEQANEAWEASKNNLPLTLELEQSLILQQIERHLFDQPVSPIEHPQQGVDFANNVLYIQDPALRREYIRRQYPNLSDATIDYMINLYENAAEGTWGKALGFHPLAVENARLTELALKRLAAQDFDFAANGYPNWQEELIGDVTKNLGVAPWGKDYVIRFNHPDGSEAFIGFDNNEHIVRPVLRPSPSTGEVHKSILLPMMREMKQVTKNPNLKGWMLGNDYGGSYDPLDLSTQSVGNNLWDFGTNGYSFDSNELMYEFAKKNKLDLYNPLSILDFNDMAFKNRDLSKAFLQATRGDVPMARKFYYEQFQPYELRIGSPKSVFGSTTGNILGGTPIIGLKKGNKLIRRK